MSEPWSRRGPSPRARKRTRFASARAHSRSRGTRIVPVLASFVPAASPPARPRSPARAPSARARAFRLGEARLSHPRRRAPRRKDARRRDALARASRPRLDSRPSRARVPSPPAPTVQPRGPPTAGTPGPLSERKATAFGAKRIAGLGGRIVGSVLFFTSQIGSRPSRRRRSFWLGLYVPGLLMSTTPPSQHSGAAVAPPPTPPAAPKKPNQTASRAGAVPPGDPARRGWRPRARRDGVPETSPGRPGTPGTGGSDVGDKRGGDPLTSPISRMRVGEK